MDKHLRLLLEVIVHNLAHNVIEVKDRFFTGEIEFGEEDKIIVSGWEISDMMTIENSRLSESVLNTKLGDMMIERKIMRIVFPASDYFMFSAK